MPGFSCIQASVLLFGLQKDLLWLRDLCRPMFGSWCLSGLRVVGVATAVLPLACGSSCPLKKVRGKESGLVTSCNLCSPCFGNGGSEEGILEELWLPILVIALTGRGYLAKV